MQKSFAFNFWFWLYFLPFRGRVGDKGFRPFLFSLPENFCSLQSKLGKI